MGFLVMSARSSRRLGPTAGIPRNATCPAVGSTRVRALHMAIIPIVIKSLGRKGEEEGNKVAGVGGVERSAPLPSSNASRALPGDLGELSVDESVRDQGE